jgi:hypothetical protein|tara:strand:+ start:482 stop:904 length:423 start_codon:yes stop_codon:yes gene_type:complete
VRNLPVSSSASDPAGNAEEPSYHFEAELPAETGKVEEERLLLEEVLRQTQAAFDAHETDELSEMGPFLEVARQHAGRELTLEPVLVDLVGAALAETIGPLPDSASQQAGIPLRIATTLFEDPSCHDRLVAFWSRLLAAQK